MTDMEKYIFDIQGYIIVEDVLSPGEVRRMIDGIPREPDGTYKHSGRDLLEPLTYSEPLYREIINHPRIMPYLSSMLCDEHERYAGHIETRPWSKRFYLSHEYGMFFRKGDKGPPFHNSNVPYDAWYAYHVSDGRIVCGLTAVIWCLSDVNAGDGGFWCIPGSHKANFLLPAAIRHYDVVPSCVVQPVVKAGSAIIFTEALTHGTKPWASEKERVALFYKYVPGHMPLLKRRSPELLAMMTAEQRTYLVAAAE